MSACHCKKHTYYQSIVVVLLNPRSQMEQRARLPKCYQGGGEGEAGERDVARRHTYSCRNVLEYGGGAGSVSSIVQQELKHKGRHVVVQPSSDGWYGGYSQLMKNRKACNMQFTAIDHEITPKDINTITSVLHGKPDCMVVDCEDCLQKEYDKTPSLFDEVRVIQVERDDANKNYEKLFKS